MLLAQVAETWHCAPSDLLTRDVALWQIDLAAAQELWRWKNEQAQEQQAEMADGPSY